MAAMRSLYPFYPDSSSGISVLFPAGPSPHLQDLLDQLARLKEEIAAMEREVHGEAPQSGVPRARRSPPRTWRDAL